MATSLRHTSSLQRALLGACLLALALFPARVLRADGAVPVKLQAAFIDKIAAFDRSMPERAGSQLKVLVLHKHGDAASTRTAHEMAQELTGLKAIGGLPKAIEEHGFVSPSEIAAACKARGVAILYVAPGLEAEMPAIARALAGISVLSVGPEGAVVGFALEESRPRILISLPRAKDQGVSLKPELLKLAKIVS